MPKTLKFLLIGAACLVVLMAATFGVGVLLGERKMQRAVDLRVVPVAQAKDAAALRLGKYLFDSRGCAECHGGDGRGRVMIDAPNGLYVRTPNLTAGAASAVAGYGDADWVRSIRHGVDPKGRALLVMPSEDYNRMNDADFAALVAYVKSLPPAAGEPALVRFPAFMKALYGFGVIQDAASKIDHKLPPAAPVPVAATVEHGAYVANLCIGCHGAGFAGGKVPGGPPQWPAAANLTPGEGSVMPRYDTLDKFVSMMRTGKRPDDTEIDKAMPFATLKTINDVDLQAVYAYLKTLPPRRLGAR